LIPTPIRQVLSTFQTNGVQALLMGGQACVFYGAAQVSKDVVAIHYRENGGTPQPEWVHFWLREARAPELLVELARRFPVVAGALANARPLLHQALAANLAALRPALDAEVRAEQDKDRAYWEPLKRELESFQRAEARERGDPKLAEP
jgi:hypothetical protein